MRRAGAARQVPTRELHSATAMYGSFLIFEKELLQRGFPAIVISL